jgi:hypothetical protein
MGVDDGQFELICLAKERTILSQPADPGSGQPLADQFRSADIALVEIAKLQNDGEHLKSMMSEVRTDMREVRDRIIKLEEIIRGEIGTRLTTTDTTLVEIKRKLDRVHNYVIGAAAVVAFAIFLTQFAVRFWPSSAQPTTPLSSPAATIPAQQNNPPAPKIST